MNFFFTPKREHRNAMGEFWALGFEFEFTQDRKCDLNVCGWVVGWLLLASVIVFLGEVFFCSFCNSSFRSI